MADEATTKDLEAVLDADLWAKELACLFAGLLQAKPLRVTFPPPHRPEPVPGKREVRTLTAGTAEGLDDMVNALLADGWDCGSTPACHGAMTWFQQMHRFVPDEPATA